MDDRDEEHQKQRDQSPSKNHHDKDEDNGGDKRTLDLLSSLDGDIRTQDLLSSLDKNLRQEEQGKPSSKKESASGFSYVLGDKRKLNWDDKTGATRYRKLGQGGSESVAKYDAMKSSLGNDSWSSRPGVAIGGSGSGEGDAYSYGGASRSNAGVRIGKSGSGGQVGGASGSASYPCKICGKTFPDQRSLASHKGSHTKQKKKQIMKEDDSVIKAIEAQMRSLPAAVESRESLIAPQGGLVMYVDQKWHHCPNANCDRKFTTPHGLGKHVSTCKGGEAKESDEDDENSAA